MFNRAAVNLPPKVQAMILQYESLLKNPEVNCKYISDTNNFRFKHLLENHSINNETHTFAEWLYLADKQNVLDYIYQQITHNPWDNLFVLHWAVICRQPLNIIEILIDLNPRLYTMIYNSAEGADTALHLAVRQGDLNIAACLIDAGKDPDLARINKTTPLHIAVAKNNIAMVKLLIAKGAGIDIKDHMGNTPLHIAVRNGNTALIAVLVEAGAGALFQNSSGDTALHLVLKKPKEEARMLLSILGKNANLGVNTTNIAGESLFVLAAEHGHLELVCQWLDVHLLNPQDRIVIDQVNINNAFKAAVRNAHADIVFAIMPFVDNFKDECSEKNGSALMIAAQLKYTDIVRMLSLHLLITYIYMRQAEPEYKIYTYFFVKKGWGFSKEHKLAAARTLYDVLEGRAKVADLKAEHFAALNNGRLQGIKRLILKFCAEGYRPLIAELNEHQTVSLNSLRK